MTMLDRMRRHRWLLKWSLLAVVVTFVVLYVPSFLKNGGAAGVSGAQADDVIATVDGQELTAGTYRRLYAQKLLDTARRSAATSTRTCSDNCESERESSSR